MHFKQKYIISQQWLTAPSKRRSGIALSPGVKFIVAHDTGNPGSTASGNVRYYERSRDEISASAHLFVDDKQILECIPALTTDRPEKAWHVIYNVVTDNHLFNYNANDAAIGVEYCYGDNINADEAYKKYLWVIAYICYKFSLDPAVSVVGHHFLDPKRKTDPLTGLAYSRRSYEQLLRDIVREYNDCTGIAAKEYTFQPNEGTAITAVQLNLRKGEPSTKADVLQTLPAGIVLNYTGWVSDGAVINGNAKWYKDINGNYFWSGGVRDLEKKKQNELV